MVDQTAVTVIAEVRPGEVGALRALLEQMGADAAANQTIPFGRFANLHFARLVLLDSVVDLDGATIPDQLVLFADVDGAADAFVRELVTTAGAGLDTIYSHCAGYPEGAQSAPDRLAYLRARMVKAGAVYVNTAGRSVTQVKQEAQLREAIGQHLDGARESLAGLDASAVVAGVQRYVGSDSSLAWALRPANGPGLLGRLRDWAQLARLGAILLLLSPLFVVGWPIGLILLRWHEMHDPAPDIRPTPEHAADLGNREDFYVQNPFMGVGFVKPGWFRRYLSSFALMLAGPIIRHYFDHGSLAGVTTIHFARWTFLDGKRRLLFGSNYDGSLESYMDDFIDRLAWGLNAIFGNGFGYPKVRWLVFDGAAREENFKHFLRVHQMPCQVWYSAYPRLSAVNIANNAAIRAGLSTSLDPAAAGEWLRRL